MTITDEQKKAIYIAYMKYANQLFDDIEDNSVITAEELVYKVIGLVEEVVLGEVLAENVKLKEINEKLSERLSWKCECTGCFNVK